MAHLVHLLMLYGLEGCIRMISEFIHIAPSDSFSLCSDTKISLSFIVREELNIRSSHGTLVVFLQNDSGYERWGPTPERLAELALSFQAAKRPGESNATTSK